ncbi:hypothetical protein GALL_551660 [mine drainage metagenome]|uniref:Uncharacterized protein n=1 Tax=mine drainage metagenome TaxID=410659 RepID=A0A1J5P767_9ZZZZ
MVGVRAVAGLPGEARERQGRDEAGAGLRENAPHLVAALGQQARQLSRLVGRHAARDPEDDAHRRLLEAFMLLQAPAQTPRASAPQMSLWSWSWKRTGRPSSTTRRASQAGSRRPQTGLKRTSTRSQMRRSAHQARAQS